MNQSIIWQLFEFAITHLSGTLQAVHIINILLDLKKLFSKCEIYIWQKQIKMNKLVASVLLLLITKCCENSFVLNSKLNAESVINFFTELLFFLV